MFRVPQEPDPVKYPEIKGVVVPESLDFEELRARKEKDGVENAIKEHVDACTKVGMDITDVQKEPYNDFIEYFITEKVPVKIHGEQVLIDVRIDKVLVAGAPDKDILGVRHTIELPFNPYVYFDGLVRLTYTELIDKFTYLVEQVEEIQSPGLSWCNVAYTADRLSWFMTERDFVTFDFVSELFMCSRSCRHPSREPTQIPSCVFKCNCDTRTYRVPLQYFQRVIPHKSDPDSCTVVQFQFSDVGGIVPQKAQTKAVVEFGIDNIPKVVSTIAEAVTKGVKLGKGSPGYLQNPLNPSWRQSAKDMLPGL